MTYPAPPPPPPPDEPVPVQESRRLKRPYVCGVLALLMAAGLIASVFWPWLTPALPGGAEVSGWDVYQSAGDAGKNTFLINQAFREGFSPLLTGLSILIAGGVLAVAALTLMAWPKVKQPSPWGVPKGLGASVSLLGVAVLLASGLNLCSLVFTQPRPYLLQPGAGLTSGVFFAAIGGIALTIGSTGALGRRRSATR